MTKHLPTSAALAVLVALAAPSAPAAAYSCLLSGECLDVPLSELDPNTGPTGPGVPFGNFVDFSNGEQGCDAIGPSEGLRYLYSIEPYGRNGWTSQWGDNLYQRVDICETVSTDSLGNRFVFWVIYDTQNAPSGGSAYWTKYRIAAQDGSTVWTIDPFGTKSGDCHAPVQFSLGVSAELVSAELAWEHQQCDWEEKRTYWTGAIVEWKGLFRPWERSATFSFGLVTRVPAGSASVLDVHHVERLCHTFCNYEYNGDFWMAAYTSGLANPCSGAGSAEFHGQFQLGASPAPAAAVVRRGLSDGACAAVAAGWRSLTALDVGDLDGVGNLVDVLARTSLAT